MGCGVRHGFDGRFALSPIIKVIPREQPVPHRALSPIRNDIIFYTGLNLSL
jgi:hypothetical protein